MAEWCKNPTQPFDYNQTNTDLVWRVAQEIYFLSDLKISVLSHRYVTRKSYNCNTNHIQRETCRGSNPLPLKLFCYLFLDLQYLSRILLFVHLFLGSEETLRIAELLCLRIRD